jgi:arylsulfatase A-like enzyme
MKSPARNLFARWVRAGDWKLIAFSPAGEPRRSALYHVADDPFEKSDLADQQPQRMAELGQRLDRWWNPQ